MKPSMHRPLIPLLIISVCLLFLGINGFIGGSLMLRDPNGSPMGMPVTDLRQTPFQNFIVPGLLLIGLWGCGSFLTLIGLWLRPRWGFFHFLSAWTHEDWGWVLCISIGLALVIWLLVQFVTLPAVAPIQYILFVLAVLLILLPLQQPMQLYYLTDDVT